MLPINFIYNPTSWDQSGRRMVGGMADALVQPILPHLDALGAEYGFDNVPHDGAVNVHYTHRDGHNAHHYPKGVEGRDVFISHGIADKAWRDARRVNNRYDYVVVSGPWWSEKMVGQGMEPSEIIEAGYTKLDPIFNGELTRVPRKEGDALRVVWAPTHNGRPAVSTWPKCLEHATTLSRWFNVTVAPHPRHRPDKRSTIDEFLKADVVVADSGSTIYEAMALGIPVVFPDWMVARAVIGRSSTSAPTMEALIYRERIGRHAASLEELRQHVIRAAIDGPTPEETELIERVLPAAYRGRSALMHAESLVDVANGVVPRHVVAMEPERIEAAREHYRSYNSGRMAVYNQSNRLQIRGGVVFPPGETVEVPLAGHALKEVRACSALVFV